VNNKQFTYILFPLLIIVGALSLGYSYISTTHAGYWKTTKVPCVPGADPSVAPHMHVVKHIFVDGVFEPLPGHVGKNDECLSAVHTMDRSGIVHYVKLRRDMTYKIQDFYEVWERNIEREGYDLKVYINGEEKQDYRSYTLEYLDYIVFQYTSLNGVGVEENVDITYEEDTHTREMMHFYE
jgi:hypothetical protein